MYVMQRRVRRGRREYAWLRVISDDYAATLRGDRGRHAPRYAARLREVNDQ